MLHWFGLGLSTISWYVIIKICILEKMNLWDMVSWTARLHCSNAVAKDGNKGQEAVRCVISPPTASTGIVLFQLQFLKKRQTAIECTQIRVVLEPYSLYLEKFVLATVSVSFEISFWPRDAQNQISTCGFSNLWNNNKFKLHTVCHPTRLGCCLFIELP